MKCNFFLSVTFFFFFGPLPSCVCPFTLGLLNQLQLKNSIPTKDIFLDHRTDLATKSSGQFYTFAVENDFPMKTALASVLFSIKRRRHKTHTTMSLHFIIGSLAFHLLKRDFSLLFGDKEHFAPMTH